MTMASLRHQRGLPTRRGEARRDVLPHVQALLTNCSHTQLGPHRHRAVRSSFPPADPGAFESAKIAFQIT